MKSDQGSAKQGGFFLTIATPAGATTKRVDGDHLTVGRADDCQLTISHETLSRRHLTVSRRDGECFIEDHGSSNGTYINGKRIKAHAPVRVRPEDQTTMGQASVRLSVSVEPVKHKDELPTQDTNVTSTNVDRQLQDVNKKAAMLIQEAELEAERRVEDVYRRAHETQAKMDEVYQKRMNEAFRSAEEIFQKAQEDSQRILDVARQRSSEIREQAESFVSQLRKRTEDDCERLLEEAQQTARDLKEQRLLEADDFIKEREEEILERARATMDERMARFDEDMAREAARQREELRIELEDRRAQVEFDHKDKIDELKVMREEIGGFEEVRKREEKQVAEARAALSKSREDLRRLQEQTDDAKKEVLLFSRELNELKVKVEGLRVERETAERQTRSAQETLNRLSAEIESAQEGLKSAQEEAAASLAQVRSRFEDEKAKLEKVEEQNFEELKLQTTRRVRHLEEQLVEELYGGKDRMSRELTLAVETLLRESPDVAQNVRKLQEYIATMLDRQIASLSQDENAKAKQASLVELKRRQKWATALQGAAAGVVIALAGEHAYILLRDESSPLQRQVAAVREKRRQDLEQRKFNPVQTRDFKNTYLDNVIYTQNFTSTYTSDDFQRQLLKGLAPYMLKTWKTDEDKVIELLGITSTLVKVLAEKRANIHPDFVSQSLEKMKQDEADATGRMRTLLGTHVRLESFRKFEKAFYESYRPGQVATQSPPPPPAPAAEPEEPPPQPEKKAKKKKKKQREINAPPEESNPTGDDVESDLNGLE